MAQRQRTMGSDQQKAAIGEAGILVVDDEEDVRAVAVMALEDAGFAVYEAAGADEALSLLEHHPEIALVVTDVMMPGPSGFHVARGVAERFPDVKVLIVSAYAAGLVDAQLPPGGFLAKPFRLDDLQSAVARLLRT